MLSLHNARPPSHANCSARCSLSIPVQKRYRSIILESKTRIADMPAINLLRRFVSLPYLHPLIVLTHPEEQLSSALHRADKEEFGGHLCLATSAHNVGRGSGCLDMRSLRLQLAMAQASGRRQRRTTEHASQRSASYSSYLSDK